MGIRHWLRQRLTEEQEGEDVPPGSSIFSTIFGRDAATPRALGEYDQKSYPAELRALLERRQEVADALMEMDLTDRGERIAAIPRLQELLHRYPHPLAYETLIHAYVDAGRWDDARGAAWAARERRLEVSRSPHGEIRAEIDRLKEWSPEEVDALRAEREGTAGVRAGAAPAS